MPVRYSVQPFSVLMSSFPKDVKVKDYELALEAYGEKVSKLQVGSRLAGLQILP